MKKNEKNYYHSILAVIKINAQDIKGGLKVTTNFVIFPSDVDRGYKGTSVMGLGYFETLDINPSLALQTEINFTNYVKFTVRKINCEDVFDKYTYNFIEFPVIIKYKIDLLHFGFGTQYGVSTNGSHNQIIGNQLNKIEIKQANDFGLLFDLSTNGDKVVFDVRYYLGFNKVYEGSSFKYVSFSIAYKLFDKKLNQE